MTHDALPETSHDVPAAPRDPSDALRVPAHRVSPRAINYWRTKAAIGAVITLGIALPIYFLVPSRPWWATALLALVILFDVVELFVVPKLRFKIHRWEVNDIAIHTRVGWLGRESRIAPLSRVQTVDSNQGPLMRRFRLASVTVTTASAAGPITITGLDADDARELVVQLTEITAATEGDAT
ncbi:PH domain-containing protein [Nocardioides sp. Y6]|uniref:PH domain-containing protein n=1 Tax=Nocardioides malaquae TaxID=2773426 RepID=A0ABR9RQP4_9ACTN|nr:PH domain-containing protein [Nocardioides malaquae]